MAKLALRAAELADIDFIQSLEQREDFAAFIYRWDRSKHEAALAQADNCYLIGQDLEGKPLGFAILRNMGDGSVPHLVRMAVSEPGRGLGHSLLKLVCDWVFDSAGAPAITLDVFEDNPRARALYRRLGFQEDRYSDGPIDRPSGQPARLVYMSLLRAAA